MQDVQALLLARVKELVLELDDCTPEVMIVVERVLGLQACPDALLFRTCSPTSRSTSRRGSSGGTQLKVQQRYACFAALCASRADLPKCRS